MHMHDLHAACTCMQRTHLSSFMFVCFVFDFFLWYEFSSYHFLLFICNATIDFLFVPNANYLFTFID